MNRYLLATTAIAALATPLAAQTVISDDRTQPVRTSTVKDGSPDSIRIDDDGSVVVSGGTAVTMDSDHTVTNEGDIKITNADGATGIAAEAGTTGDIVNSGTITIDETYTPEDIDNDGDLDGPFAVGTGRAGIRTLGAHTGDISNSGKIVVEGNDSAGIVLGGTLTGDFTHDGETTVTGTDSVGVRTQDIDGDVRLAGKVTVRGEGAIGAQFGGDVDGAMVVQGEITSTGYRYPTPPSDQSKLDADDKLQGGSALVIEGDVTGGIVLAAAPKDSDSGNDDEDGDGIDDDKEGTAKIVSAGEAPAMVIGAEDRDIAIGSVAGSGNDFGLIIEGEIGGSGVYSGVDGNGLVIGGRGGAVDIANGMAISGTVAAKAVGAAEATALRIGADATVPEIRNSGTISASAGSDDESSAVAVVVDEGANVETIRNSGTIKATVSGEDGTATAIVDHSGGVELVENSGAISATGADEDSDRNVAIDLSANTAGATVRQTEVASGKDAPSIKGNVLFGSGDDTFEIADGTVDGKVTFGGGDNTLALSGDAKQTGNVVFGDGGDTMSLAGKSVFDGTVDFGGGADELTLAGSARFTGSLTNAANLAVKVDGGVLGLSRPTAIGSLDMASGAILDVTLDKDAGEGTLIDVAGTATFDDGAKLRFRLADIDDAEGRYVVLTADDLQIGEELEGDSSLLPFMYKATIDAEAANELAVDIERKTGTELGLNRSQSAAYGAILDALGEDDEIAGVFLNITDGDSFRDTVTLMLPDHAGGAFEGVSLGTRTMSRFLTDPQGPIEPESKIQLIFDAGGWGSQKEQGETAAYDQSGLGFAAGAEIATSLGRFGGTVTYLWNRHDIGDTSAVHSGTYEVAAHWVGKWGGLQTFARAGIGMVDFDGTRHFDATVGDETISRDIEREWDGTVTSFMGGASFEGGSQFFFFRPAVSFDYVRLKEDGYTDTGGEGLNLTVSERTSDEFAVNGGLTLGVDFKGMRARDRTWFRIEGEGGWREIVGGSLGDTTAQFEDGDPFTLQAEQSANGWYARLRALGGDEAFTISGEAGAEERHDDVGFTLRGTIRMGF